MFNTKKTTQSTNRNNFLTEKANVREIYFINALFLTYISYLIWEIQFDSNVLKEKRLLSKSETLIISNQRMLGDMVEGWVR